MDTLDKRLCFIGALLIIIALFGWNNIVELRAEEPRRAIVSMEMILTGDYLAGFMPYQIPYYITKRNRSIVKFEKEFAPNQYYLARMDELELKGRQVNVLYRYFDNWLSREVVLFKTDNLKE